VFIEAPGEVAANFADRKAEGLKKELKGLREQLAGIQKEMNQLKSTLYAKFGDSINLEA